MAYMAVSIESRYTISGYLFHMVDSYVIFEATVTFEVLVILDWLSLGTDHRLPPFF